MNRILYFIVVVALLGACTPIDQQDGVWYVAYRVSEQSQREPVYETVFLEFRNQRLVSVLGSEGLVGPLIHYQIGSSLPKSLGLPMLLVAKAPDFVFSSDSMMVRLDEETFVFRKLPDRLKRQNMNTDCFRGSFLIQGPNYRDSIHLISDSLAIYTGRNNSQFPGKQLEFVDYAGFKLLNVRMGSQPATVVTHCDETGIDLIWPSIDLEDIRLTPTKGLVDRKQLIGSWIEVENSTPAPPAPTDYTDAELRLSIAVNSDSMTIEKRRIKTRLAWELTADGQRIYFPERFFERAGSWKLLEVSDTEMTVWMSSKDDIGRDTVRFERVEEKPKNEFQE